MFNTWVSFIIGYSLGVCYGFWFTQKTVRTPFSFLSQTRSLLIRFLFLGGLYLTFLQSSMLMTILTVVTFFMGFWTVIIRKGMSHHEQS